MPRIDRARLGRHQRDVEDADDESVPVSAGWFDADNTCNRVGICGVLAIVSNEDERARDESRATLARGIHSCRCGKDMPHASAVRAPEDAQWARVFTRATSASSSGLQRRRYTQRVTSRRASTQPPRHTLIALGGDATRSTTESTVA